MKTIDTDLRIKGMGLLLNKIEYIINNQDIETFKLEMFDFNLSQYDLAKSTYIKLIKMIYTTLKSVLSEETEIFCSETGKFFFLNLKAEESNNISKEIIKAIKQKEKSLEEEIELSSIKSSVVKYPQEADNFDSLINILEEKINKQGKERFPLRSKSITIIRKEEYIDEVEKASTQLYLLAKNDNIEVIRQNIIADKTFQIAAGDENSFELFYILEGTIASEDEKLTLEAGDSITAKSGEEEKYFKTLTDVNLLYISSTPIFASEQKRINDLMDLNDRIAEKDNETREHCRRLQELSRLTAIELELNEEKLFNLGYASFLHDIGKSRVPKKILQKPGKLTEKEWEIMKKHTEWGKEIILEKINNKHFKKTAEIIYQHHERYDGKGYPQGLKGDKAMVEAQILTVVDAYDAMVYERPYQRALTREEALAEIKKEKGKQFAPRVVEFFLKAEKKFVRENSK